MLSNIQKSNLHQLGGHTTGLSQVLPTTDEMNVSIKKFVVCIKDVLSYFRENIHSTPISWGIKKLIEINDLNIPQNYGKSIMPILMLKFRDPVGNRRDGINNKKLIELNDNKITTIYQSYLKKIQKNEIIDLNFIKDIIIYYDHILEKDNDAQQLILQTVTFGIWYSSRKESYIELEKHLKSLWG